MEKIKWYENALAKTDAARSMVLVNEAEAQRAYRFHRSFPQYTETPLVSLDRLAARLGVRGFWVKDESSRFALNAFKALGGSYAIARVMAERLGVDIGALDYASLVSDETKKKLGDITFYTATDGNHGRGVAWAASRFRQKAVVLMPKGSSAVRLANIRKEGADASITDLNYDNTVRLVSETAGKDPNGVLVQDTAWPGYEKIPAWIMQGYGTMSFEALSQLRAAGVERPTHLFVQAGVGTLAGSVQGFFANVFGERCPITTVVEANAADCHCRSVVAGKLVAVGGDLNTIMAGLACGEVNPVSWEILRNKSRFFVSVPDWVAARGMRILGNPLCDEKPENDDGEQRTAHDVAHDAAHNVRVVSGESGAATTGLAVTVLDNADYRDLRDALGLNADSVILTFSTEGDTDPARYRSIVWDGAFPSYAA
jgi:diaminopropionate ammonia-lyase